MFRFSAAIKILILTVLTIFTLVIINQKKQIKIEFQSKKCELPKINPQETNKINVIIENINKKNQKINNFGAKFDSTVITKNITVGWYGDFFYEKNKKLRLMGHKIGLKQVDIGSNDNIFWFWSRQFDNKNYYFSKHENIKQTRLRLPFHPKQIITNLCLQTLEKDPLYEEDEKYYRLFYQQDAQTFNLILIDKKLELICGNYLYHNNNLIIGSEIKSFHNINGQQVPEIIVSEWVEEKTAIEFEFNNIEINFNVQEEIFKMPTNVNSIDMTNY